MSQIKTVALAGASGSMGKPILQALLDAGFEVTALTRADSSSTFPSNVKVAKVDYDSTESLTSALKGQDALISTLATTAVGQQHNMVDAVFNAGVKRFIPSEFGCDLENPKTRQFPVFGGKVAVEDELAKRCPGTETSYTLVFNNAFFDWGIDMKFIINLPEKKFTVYDDINKAATFNTLPTIGKGVVGILKNLEATKNRAVRLNEVNLTQKKFLELAQEAVGKDGWTVEDANSAEIEKQSMENFQKDPSNVPAWAFGLLKRGIFGDGYGGDFSKNNDNEVLGLKQASDKEVLEIIKSRA